MLGIGTHPGARHPLLPFGQHTEVALGEPPVVPLLTDQGLHAATDRVRPGSGVTGSAHPDGSTVQVVVDQAGHHVADQGDPLLSQTEHLVEGRAGVVVDGERAGLRIPVGGRSRGWYGASRPSSARAAQASVTNSR